MNIKGLYFKLNIDNPNDEEIYNFFINETKRSRINKIKLLHLMIRIYKARKVLEDDTND